MGVLSLNVEVRTLCSRSCSVLGARKKAVCMRHQCFFALFVAWVQSTNVVHTCPYYTESMYALRNQMVKINRVHLARYTCKWNACCGTRYTVRVAVHAHMLTGCWKLLRSYYGVQMSRDQKPVLSVSMQLKCFGIWFQMVGRQYKFILRRWYMYHFIFLLTGTVN